MLAANREAYARDEIDLAELERRAEEILRTEWQEHGPVDPGKLVTR